MVFDKVGLPEQNNEWLGKNWMIMKGPSKNRKRVNNGKTAMRHGSSARI